ncbi:acetyltransferase [Aerococcus viridans]
MMDKSMLIIIGASGHGKVVAEIAQLNETYKKIYFMDDYSEKSSFHGLKILGPANNLHHYKDKADIFVAIGNNSVRKYKIEKLLEENYSVPILIHPNAVISHSTNIGKGTVVMAGVIINASVEIGLGVIVNTNSTIDHDSIIGNYTHISPGVSIAGTVKLGDEVWIGINSTIINNINVLDNILIGAGGLVIKDLVDSGVYVGTPVKKIK